MEKRYATIALGYAVTAMVFGVFFREFTKFSGYTGVTSLSVIHSHYFVLGMVFFLVLLLLEKNFRVSEQKGTGKLVVCYQVGLNITGLGFLVRGVTQVWGTSLGRAMDAALSGVAGVGHIILGVSLIILLLRIRKKVA